MLYISCQLDGAILQCLSFRPIYIFFFLKKPPIHVFPCSLHSKGLRTLNFPLNIPNNFQYSLLHIPCPLFDHKDNGHCFFPLFCCVLLFVEVLRTPKADKKHGKLKIPKTEAANSSKLQCASAYIQTAPHPSLNLHHQSDLVSAKKPQSASSAQSSVLSL